MPAILMTLVARLVKKIQVTLMTVPAVQDIMNPQAAAYLVALCARIVIHHRDARAVWIMLAVILATVGARQDIISQALSVTSVALYVNHAIAQPVLSA